MRVLVMVSVNEPNLDYVAPEADNVRCYWRVQRWPRFEFVKAI